MCREEIEMKCRHSSVIMAAILTAGAVGLTGCGLDHERDVSLNQLPYNVRYVVAQEVGDGYIQEIEQYSDDGMVYYEIEYERAGEDFELRVDDSGSILAKKDD